MDCPPHCGQARVLAFGDYFHGEQRGGLYAIEALRQEVLGSDVHLEYLATEYGRLPGLLMGASLGIVLHWVHCEAIHGEACCLDIEAFLHLLRSGKEEAVALAPLARVVQGMFLADMQPRQLFFVLAPTWSVGPDSGLCKEERQMIRQVVARVKECLHAGGFSAGMGSPLPRLYGFPWLKRAL